MRSTHAMRSARTMRSAQAAGAIVTFTCFMIGWSLCVLWSPSAHSTFISGMYPAAQPRGMSYGIARQPFRLRWLPSLAVFVMSTGPRLEGDRGVRGGHREVAAHRHEDLHLTAPHRLDRADGVETVLPGRGDPAGSGQPVQERVAGPLVDPAGPVPLDVAESAYGGGVPGGQHPVEDHAVVRGDEQGLVGLRQIDGLVHRQTGRPQRGRHPEPEVRVVLHQQHSHGATLGYLRRTRVQRSWSPPGTLPSGRNSTELMYRVRRGTNARRSSP